MPPRLNDDVTALLRRQRGLIAYWQATELGLGRAALRRACATGWMRVTPHVLCDREGDLTVAQIRVAGVLECGPTSLLAGRSALAEAGWRGNDEDVIEVIAPRGTRHRAAPRPGWLRVHHPEDEVRGGGFPPRTRTARAAIDAAAWARTPKEVLFLLTSAAQQRLVTLDQLQRELEVRRRVRNAPVIRSVLASMREGVTTVGEERFLRECRRRGLPKPRLQVVRRGDGKIRRVDAEFRGLDGRLVIVEIDGIGHLEVGTWHDDVQRHNELAFSTGAVILRVTNWQLEYEPESLFTVLAPLVRSASSIWAS